MEESRSDTSAPDVWPSATIGIDDIPDAVIIADEDTSRIVRTNPAATELFRCERGALIGRPQTELHPAGETELYVEAFQRGLDNQRVNRLQSGEPLFIETCDGERIPVEINVQTLTVEGDDYLMGVFREASEQQARERALKLTTNRLETLLDAVPVPVAFIDTEGIVRRWNNSAEEVLGYTAEDIVRQRYSLFTDAEEFAALLGRVIEGERLQNYQTTLRAADGSLVPVQVDASPVYDDGTVSGVVGTAVDVSDRNQREQQLDILHRMARHNLRNELNVIHGWSAMLEEGNCEPERAATKITDASDRLTELSKEVTNIPRVVSGHEQETTPRDAGTVVTTLSEQLQTNNGVADVELSTRSATGQVPGEAVRATAELFGNLTDRDDSATVKLEYDSLDSHVEILVHSNTQLLSSGERMLIEQGTETALEHATGLSIARSYLTLQSVGGTVAVAEGPTNTPASALQVEVPRADT